jgi:hypothetical protein
VNCRDCGAKEGELHKLFCLREICPFCNGQLSACSCIHSVLRLTPEESKAVEEYIDDFQEPLKSIIQRWQDALSVKGRIRWIHYPLLCSKCGVLYPKFFRVSDEEWQKYIQPDMRETIICEVCYKQLKESIDRSKD